MTLMSASFNKVFIVDDHPLMREGLRSLMQSRSYEIVGEASNVETAVESIRKLQPHLIVLDHTLQGESGLDVMRALEEQTSAQFILVTQTENPAILHQYLKSGVQYLVSKVNSQDELIKALEHFSKGQGYICPALKQVLEKSDKTASLTARELEVLRYIAQGKTNKEVAQVLKCSDHTIKTHKTNIMRKLDIPNAVGISVWAIKNQIA